VNLTKVLAELRRRNVYKVAVAYAVVGWALAQGIAQVFPVFDIPNWVVRLLVLLIVLGFPIALMIAWGFEATPDGIKRTEVADVAGQRTKLSLPIRRFRQLKISSKTSTLHIDDRFWPRKKQQSKHRNEIEITVKPSALVILEPAANLKGLKGMRG
jgi:hypothetical protein